jgi:hypothetical protein
MCIDWTCVDACGTYDPYYFGSFTSLDGVTCPGEFPGDEMRKIPSDTAAGVKNRMECSAAYNIAPSYMFINGPWQRCIQCGRLGQLPCQRNKPTTVWPVAGINSGAGCAEGTPTVTASGVTLCQ